MLAPIEVRCDRCGEDRHRYTFCPRCALYVCSACWDSAGDACLTCLRPGLPVGSALQSAIRSTVGYATHLEQAALTSRVSRSIVANARQEAGTGGVPSLPASGGYVRVRPAPTSSTVAAPGHAPRHIDWGSYLRLAVMSVLLAAAMLVIPAVFEERGATAPSAPAAGSSDRGEATPKATARDGRLRNAAQEYTVRPGDTLRLIAVRVYGDESRWVRIYEANRDLLASPDDLVAGMELEIP